MTVSTIRIPPTEVYHVTTDQDWAVYTRIGAARSALKTSPSWRMYVRDIDSPRHSRIKPRAGLRVLRAEIGSTDGWQDVTDQFVKDGEWAW